jgi:hypothetical protein
MVGAAASAAEGQTLSIPIIFSRDVAIAKQLLQALLQVAK